MAPKQKTIMDKLQTKETEVTKNDQAAIKSSLKAKLTSRSATQEEKDNALETLTFYESLSRWDKEKHSVIQNWKKDKSCRWISNFVKSTSSSKAKAVEGAAGYATKYIYKLVSKCSRNQFV